MGNVLTLPPPSLQHTSSYLMTETHHESTMTRKVSAHAQSAWIALPHPRPPSHPSLQRADIVADRLRAYREDLADWLSRLFDTNITEATLLAEIGQWWWMWIRAWMWGEPQSE